MLLFPIRLYSLCLPLLLTPTLWADDKPAIRVGEIAIYGNYRTTTNTILDVLGYYPGQKIKDRRDFILAERRLFFFFRSHFDQQTGQVPRIILTPRKSNPKFYDLHIWFPEKAVVSLRKNQSMLMNQLNNQTE